ncbi:inositol-1-monophosphatase [Skeletonema marinoi]|uniref:Inositol-1-monophosphatase n=1 Tax=Skeletonema marinoi TaxID=267567 RepID=A0AAD8Y1J7_9STRA|nr:inositol-1-monophosphatase [Skeletonema marinoi]
MKKSPLLTSSHGAVIIMLSSIVIVSSAFQSLLAPTRRRQIVPLRRSNRIIPDITSCNTNNVAHRSLVHSNTCRNLPSMALSLSHDNTNNGSESESYIYTTLDDEITTTTTTTTSRNLQHTLHTIEYAAYTAGKVALSTSGQIAVKSTKANIRDLVTESDVKCQQLIREIIEEEFPQDAFLGEEDVDLSGDSSCASSAALDAVLSGGGSLSFDGDGDASSSINDEEEDRLLFIVDPIDGTTNFQAGLPIYAMSIGVVALPSSSSSSSLPEVVAGVIYNPTLGEMTSAVRGRGCYLNNRRLQQPQQHQSQQQLPPRTSILNQSLINVGFPISKESTLQASSKAVAALATKVRGLRMVACASQAMAWVAQSKFNGYFSWDLNGWDVAAGIVIVEESGGLVSKMVVDDGDDGMTSSRAGVETRDMIITCPCERRGEEGLLRDELIEVLKENDCLDY